MLLTIWSGAAAYGRVAAAVETNQPLLAMLEILAPQEKILADQEIFLLGADVAGNALRLVIAEEPQDAERLAA